MAEIGPYFFYMVLLGLMVGGYVVHQARGRMGETLRNALVWVLVFVMVIIGYGYRDVFLSQVSPGRPLAVGENAIRLQRSADGHFYASLSINGSPVTMFVDTGASDVVLSRADAARIGIDPASLAYSGLAQTANGRVRTAPVRLDRVEFGGFEDTRVRASVSAGDMDASLLGMSYLERFARIEIRGDTMLLER